MTKTRLMSLLLALIMVVSAFAATSCSNTGNNDVLTDGNDSSGTTGGSETDESDETDAPSDETTEAETNADGLLYEYFDDYVTDSADQYTGMVGLGASGSGVHFDDFKVSTSVGKEMYTNDFETETELKSGVFTAYSSELADWAIETDTTDETNHMLSYTGSDDAMLLMGVSRWGALRFNVFFMLDDDDSVAHYYFCVTDENNYYDLAISSTTATVSQVTDGTSAVITQLAISTPTGEFVSALVNVKSTLISIYIDGNEYFHVGQSETDLTLLTGMFGIGQWQTQILVDNFTITDIASGEVIYVEDFEGDTIDTIGQGSVEFGTRSGGGWTDTTNSNGDWIVTDVDLNGNAIGSNALEFQGATSEYGAAVLFDIDIPSDCEGYKITVDAYRIGGSSSTSEFIAVIWGWDSESDYVNYNWGGWSGCGGFQTIIAGTKTNDEMSNSIGLTTGEWVTLEVYVYANVYYAYYNGTFIQCQWLD